MRGAQEAAQCLLLGRRHDGERPQDAVRRACEPIHDPDRLRQHTFDLDERGRPRGLYGSLPLPLSSTARGEQQDQEKR